MRPLRSSGAAGCMGMRQHYLPLSHVVRAARPSPIRGAPDLLAIGVTVAVVAAAWSPASWRPASRAPRPPAAGYHGAGPVVRAALPLVRVVSDVAAALTLGVLLLAATMVPGACRSAAPASRAGPRPQGGHRVGVRLALAAGVGVVLTFADAAGMPLSDPSFGAQLTGSVWSIETLRVGLLSGHRRLRRRHRRRARDVPGGDGRAHRRRPLRRARARACRPCGRLVGPRDGRQRARRAPRRRLALARRAARSRRAASLAR